MLKQKLSVKKQADLRFIEEYKIKIKALAYRSSTTLRLRQATSDYIDLGEKGQGVMFNVPN